ncbi:hypothetical protein ACN47E_000161 [Coniothyrium glycines]
MSTQPAPSRPAPDRRSSTAPKRTSVLPKPTSVILDASVLVAQHAQLTGTYPITIGSNAVLHPHSKLSSAVAPVVVGQGCVIHEKAKIGIGMSADLEVDSRRSSMASPRSSTSIRDSMRSEGVVLGRNVVVESNAIVEAAEVGEGSVIEVGAVLCKGCMVGRFCTITASSIIPPGTILADFTVVYNGSEQRVDKTLKMRPEILDQKTAVHEKQLEMFRKLIANNLAKWA